MNKQTVVVSGILPKNGQVLLAKRPLSKKIAPGKYHLPGGHVEFDEHPRDTLVREYKEEFKLDISVGGIVNVFSYTNDDVHTVGITYLVQTDNIPDDIWYDPVDTDSLTWASISDLSELFDPSDHDFQTLGIYFKQ